MSLCTFWEVSGKNVTLNALTPPKPFNVTLFLWPPLTVFHPMEQRADLLVRWNGSKCWKPETNSVKGMYPAPHIHEHLRYTIMATELRTPSRTHNNIMLEHTAMNDKNTITHTDAYNTQFWARRAPSVDAHVFTHRTCGSSLALCVIPCHPCMRTCVWLFECSLLTRLSTSSSSSSSSSTWCPTRRLTSSPTKISCATPAWGAWSLWTMSHSSQFKNIDCNIHVNTSVSR